MEPIEKTCDSQRIEDYLDERLSDTAILKFEQHLSDCECCRSKLQERSAEPEMWRDAMALLSSGHGDACDQSSEGSDNAQPVQDAFGVLGALAPTDDPDMLGRIGGYEIIGVVGVGGMGAVLKGFDKSLRRVVAIKVMAPHLANSGSARARFQREARAAAAITHDNVIDTYGVSEENGLPYLVMPFARGPSLQKRIDEGGPLTALEVVRIGLQIASGLAAAHEQGLVHRDIKPANILLNQGNERLWITDFGVARAVDDASMTRTGVIAGTPQYMSPEQARGESVDRKSDLFSMGSVLYTACTGRPPFRSEAAYGILRRITDTDPRPIREINADIPEWLCRIIERLMAKDPADRFGDAVEVSELLEGCLAHLQQPTLVDLPRAVAAPQCTEQAVNPRGEQRSRRIRSETKPHSSRGRRRGLWTGIGLLLLAGMGLAFAQLTKPVDIAGRWSGETWKSVSLSGVEEAAGWYTGSFSKENGEQGAIQLEWSRLQQRYNGRWKAGDDLSGSITLRASGDQLLGAVAVDADLSVPAETPRLREFAWKRAFLRESEGELIPFPEWAAGPPISIESPLKGRIVRWGDGVFENCRVEKGDLIAEVAKIDPAYFDQLENQIARSANRVAAANQNLEASQRTLKATQAIVEQFKTQVTAYEDVAKQIAAASAVLVESAKNKVEVAQAERDELVAARDQAQAEFDRQKTLFEKGLVSQLKLRQSESQLKEAEAKVKKAEALIEVAKNEVATKENEKTAKQDKAKADLDQAVLQVSQAKAKMAKVENEIAKAERELTAAQADQEKWQTKLSRQAKFDVKAPVTGFVTDLIDAGTTLKQGDGICTLWPERARNETGEDNTDDESASGDKTGEGEESSSPSSSNASSVSDADNPRGSSPDQVSELLRTLSQIAEDARKRFRLGTADMMEVIEAEQKLTNLRLAIADADERPSIRKTQLELAKELEAFIEDAVKHGARPPADLLKAKAYRLELESIIRREEDRKSTPPADDKDSEASIRGTGKVVAFVPREQQRSGSSSVPQTSKLAVELWISGNDAPLVQRGDKVRLQFEGWPAIQSAGTFGGEVMTINPAADDNGRFRILVIADGKDSWPDEPYLHPDVRASGWVITGASLDAK